MILVIHGDDTHAVSTSSQMLLTKEKDITRIDLKRDSVDTLTQALLTDGLFEAKKTIVITNLTAVRGKALEKLIQHVMSYKDNTNVTVYIVDYTIYTPSVLKHFVGVKVELYKLPKYFFTFLDNLSPKKAKTQQELLHKLFLQNSPEQLFYSMVNRVRLLLILKSSVPSESTEVRRMSDWQLSKIKQQAHAWDTMKLVSFYKKLYDIEVRMKTSGLPLSLSSHLDILIGSELI